ncbi:MAG TPA: hypothetical protein VFN26_17840 [Candidatus Acidoferrum sp.]|nr:hypothetical protein [Candidatus Acidoferrum sp.]
MTTHDVRSIERRRSARVAASIAVRVQGQARSGQEFNVQTHTHTVSLFGCLILLDVEIFVDRKVVLTREDTHQSVEGKFVSTWRHPDGRRFVGVAFSSVAQDFWRVAIPSA